MLSQNDLDWYAARLSLAVYDTKRDIREMQLHDMREALKDIPGHENLEIEYESSGHQLLRIDGKVLEVGPAASNAEIVLALKNTLVRTENTKVITVMSAIDRIKAKALQARDIAPAAIRAFEADLDGILAEREELERRRAASVAPHKEGIAGIYGEFDGLKQAMDIMTNGAPSGPLPGSEPESKG
jgi:hypothetical protein